jgi:hypothetical protein
MVECSAICKLGGKVVKRRGVPTLPKPGTGTSGISGMFGMSGMSGRFGMDTPWLSISERACASKGQKARSSASALPHDSLHAWAETDRGMVPAQPCTDSRVVF